MITRGLAEEEIQVDLGERNQNLTLQGSKLKKNSSRLLAIIKEKRSPNAKLQSPDNIRTETQI